jgi:phage/plasmid-like protein (TIGR03299 family)
MTNPAYDPTIDDWGNTYDAIERGVQHHIDGDSFASVRDKAWHNLGYVHEGQVDALTLLRSANADYDVFQVDLHGSFIVPSGGLVLPSGVLPGGKVLTASPEGQVANCRFHPVTGEFQILGIVSRDGYQIVTNREAFVGFGDALVQVTEPIVSTCGVLFEGRQAFMCWRLPFGSVLGQDEDIQWWLLVRTSHDGSTKLTAAIVPLRTVCFNTCRYNLAHAIGEWSITHSRNATLNLRDARESLKLVHSYRERFERASNALLGTEMNVRQFEAIIKANFGPDDDAKPAVVTRWENRRDELVQLFRNADTQANVRNTAWAGVQAVGEFCDWFMPVRRTAVEQFDTETGYRFFRSLSGNRSVTRVKQTTLAAIAEFAGVQL